MKLSEQQIKEIEEVRRQFLWKVQIFENGLNHEREEKKGLVEKIKGTVKYELYLKEGMIFDKKIESLDEKEFAYQLGKHVQSIAIEIVKIFSEVIYPLDSILEDYENQIKEILL